MPPEESVTHHQLWIAITELSGEIKTLTTLMAVRDENAVKIREDVNSLYERVRQVENLKGQVIAIATLMLALGTALNSWITPRLSFTAPTIQQEAKP